MFLCGIGRGSISIINNHAVNDIFENPAKMLNYLHCSFAVGAFLAPLATAMMTWLFYVGDLSGLHRRRRNLN